MPLVTFEFPSKTKRIEFPAEVAQLVEQSSEELRTVSPCRGRLRPEIGATDWVGFFAWATRPQPALRRRSQHPSRVGLGRL